MLYKALERFEELTEMSAFDQVRARTSGLSKRHVAARWRRVSMSVRCMLGKAS
jgi:hypothetical protein